MKKTYAIQVDCPVCAGKMERTAASTPGVQAAAVNFAAQSMTVTFAPGADSATVMEQVVTAVKAVEEEAAIFLSSAEKPEEEKKGRGMAVRLGLAVALTAAVELSAVSGWLRLCLYLLPYLIIGWDILWKAARGLWQRQLLDENFLMAVATVGAFLLGALQTGDYLEAVAVMALYQLGELLQGYAVGKSRRSIRALLDIRPDYANIEHGDHIERVAPDTVPVGSVIVIHPGERIPLDGTVLEGASTLDTAALTGESLPRGVTVGDAVAGGCVNLTGVLRVRTDKAFADSAASRVLRLVEEAGSSKAKAENLITRFARVYTPAVCVAALVLALLPPLVRLGCGLLPQWSVWLYRALTALVISCPCALVISVPLTFFAGIGGAGRLGVLVKGANYLEALAKTGCVVTDKTGTLTVGRFEVEQVDPVGMAAEDLLAYAALAEHASSHPISRSLLTAYGKPVDRRRVADVQEQSGRGVTALVDGVPVAVGSAAMLTERGISVPALQASGTVVYVAINGVYAGVIRVADRLKPTAVEAIRRLHAAGVERLVMLTGDTAAAAQPVAAALAVDEVHAGLLPEDKVARVEALLATLPDGQTLAFVGDGINDAPVLARADIGVAMGALGSDAAIEAADVVLMDDDPRRLASAIRHARRCMGIVRQNILFSLLVKGVCLILGALGGIPMWLAIFADVGVMLLAVGNALRALMIARERRDTHDENFPTP